MTCIGYTRNEKVHEKEAEEAETASRIVNVHVWEYLLRRLT